MNKTEEILTITESQLAEWHKDLSQLQQQQAILNQKIMTMHQKIQFASIMFAEKRAQKNGNVSSPLQQTLHQGVTSAPVTSLKLPHAIMSFFPPESKERKTKTEIKTALKESGFTKLGTNDAYFYTTMRRLVEKNQLTKNGDFYSRKAH